MTGHIILISCLLAICLPIICVQLPRFELVKELRTEIKPEARSTILRGRPLSPEKTLRRNSRYRSEADIDATSVELRQWEGGSQQSAQATARRQHADVSGPISKGDSSADSGASSREKEGKTNQVKTGRKPRDLLFGRQRHVIVPSRDTPPEGWSTGNSSSPSRMTGRGPEALGLATRIFSPDPIADLELDDEHDGPWPTPLAPVQGLLHRRLARMKPPQAHGDNGQGLPNVIEKIHSVSLHGTDTVSLPSPFDGSPLASGSHTPQNVPLAESKRHSCCHHKHCRHTPSDTTLRQSLKCLTAAHKGSPKTVSHYVKNSTPEGIATKPDTDERAKTDAKAISEKHSTSFVSWKALLVVSSLVVFIFAFAVLVAHCLAWFLVYRTEARLGEVRSGLLRGGEMKLCLCGKG